MTAGKKMLVIAAFASLAAGLSAVAQDTASRPAGNDARQGDPYLLDVCPVSKEKLDENAVVVVHEGREIRLCCKGCVKELRSDPAAVMKAADELIIKDQLRYYPTKQCIVSDEPLEEPVDVVAMNRLVRLCCKGCQKELLRDPKKVIAKLDEAVVAKQAEHYPLKTCPLSGEPVDAEAVQVVYGSRLMRFCCNRCVRGFEKNPTAHVAALDKAWMVLHGGGEHGAHGGHEVGGDHGAGGEHGRVGGG